MYAFKDYVSFHNVETLNTFNPEIQLKDTDLQLKTNWKSILTQLKAFKFVTTLVLAFKKIESDDKTKYDTFYFHSKTVYW